MSYTRFLDPGVVTQLDASARLLPSRRWGAWEGRGAINKLKLRLELMQRGRN